MKKKGSSITRVLEILESIATAKHPPSPLDLAIDLDIPKPSIHRLLQTLEQEGYIKYDSYGGYALGDRTTQWLISGWEQEPRKMQRLAILQKLSSQVGETCGIAILNNNQMLYTDRVQTNWPLQVYLPVGSTVPLWCSSSGKLFLSFLEPVQRKKILSQLPIKQLTKNTMTDIDALDAHLDEIFQRQLGSDNEEFIAGMVACSVPILKDGNIIACLYIHAPTIRKSLEDLQGFEALLRESASALQQLFKCNSIQPCAKN